MRYGEQHLVLLDPGLHGEKGHHFSTALAVGEHCAGNNIRCDLVIHKNAACQSEAFFSALRGAGWTSSIQSAISYPLYTERVDYAGYVEQFLVYADLLAGEMDEAVAPLLTEKSVILCHSANAAILRAFALWMRCLAGRARPGIVLNLQFPSMDPGDRMLDAALAQVRPYSNIRITGSNAPICRHLASRLGRPVHVLPVPMPPAVPRTPPEGNEPVFGTAGEAREDKNMGILPEAVDAYLASGGRGRFLVQLDPTSRNLDAMLREALPALRDKYPDRVELRLEALYGPEYFEHIRRCDALILPYHPEQYVRRVSQVVMEAAALGVSCITTRASTLGEELLALDNGSAFMDGTNAADLAAAMAAFAGDLAGNRARAAAASRAFAAYHNVTAYMDVVFDTNGTYPYPAFAVIRPECPIPPLPEVRP